MYKVQLMNGLYRVHKVNRFTIYNEDQMSSLYDNTVVCETEET